MSSKFGPPSPDAYIYLAPLPRKHVGLTRMKNPLTSVNAPASEAKRP